MRNARTGILGLAVITASTLLIAVNLDELTDLLRNRTGEAGKAVGIVAGLVDKTGERFVASGGTAPGGRVPPDADTVFEIGSVTKVFTSLALADMAVRGEVKLDDPVAKFLPAAVRLPERDGKKITLLDLSHQVSGLPRMPDNFKPANMLNPYSDYGPAQMYEFLAKARLTRDIGEKYEYSNLGVGLLGHALALKAGTSYERLIRKRVLEPLGMDDTAIILDERLTPRLATGSGPSLSAVRNWDFDVLAGAGALRSSARDMLRFLTAALGLRETPLRAAFDLMLRKRRPTGTPDLEIGLGWHIWKRYGTEIVWHNGGTGGYRSFAGFDPAKKTGVVFLCNTSFGVDDLGLHSLEPQWPVARFRPPLKGQPVTVPEKALANFAGDYELDADRAVTVSVSDGRLYLKETGRPMFEYKPESPTDFYRTADDRVTFVIGPSGSVRYLVRYQNGFELEARKKAEEEDLAVWRQFVSAMKQGGPASDRIRPYYEQLREPLLGFLKEMRTKASWEEWDGTPEVFRVGEHVHFLLPLTFDGRTAEYNFTFLTEGGRWSFRHLEAITLRLDRTGPPPTSVFPDVDEETKAHIREETLWSREVRVFNVLSELKGKDFAFDFFKDGDGYFLAARTWVPFLEPPKAFILYACWEQANLRGNTVTLEKLDDNEAVVRMSTYYYGLFKASAHLAQQISFEDYTRIFETIWHDRARAAGWTLEIEYGNEGFRASTCLLHFKKGSAPPGQR